jgi:hypothetical protein
MYINNFSNMSNFSLAVEDATTESKEMTIDEYFETTPKEINYDDYITDECMIDMLKADVEYLSFICVGKRHDCYKLYFVNEYEGLIAKYQPNTKMRVVVEDLCNIVRKDIQKTFDRICRQIKSEGEAIMVSKWGTYMIDFLKKYAGKYGIEYYMDDNNDMHIIAINRAEDF